MAAITKKTYNTINMFISSWGHRTCKLLVTRLFTNNIRSSIILSATKSACSELCDIVCVYSL